MLAIGLWVTPVRVRADETDGSSPALATNSNGDAPEATDHESVMELRARVEQMERQNQYLMDALRSTRSAPTRLRHGGYIRPVGDLEGPLGSEDNSDERFDRMEEDYEAERRSMQTQDESPEGPSRGALLVGRWGTGFVNNGLWFESEKKDFRLHVGGRTQWDTSFFHANDQVQFNPGGTGPIKDGTDFRRARIRIEGAMYEQSQFCVEYDFVDSTTISGATPPGTPDIPSPRDVWWNFSQVPLFGNVRLGNQKEPYGFEVLLSSRWLNLMERSYNTEIFYSPYSAGFSPGIQFWTSYLDNRVTWSWGVFRNVVNNMAFEIGAGAFAVTGRLTGLPIYKDDGKRLIHLGVSGRSTGLNNGIVHYRTRGDERVGNSANWPLYLNTANINGSGRQDVNFELVSVWKSFTLQAEYNFDFVQNAFLAGQAPVGILFFQGGYAELSYFLTGETREYVKEVGLFDRVVPKENAYLYQSKSKTRYSLGAWQATARYNYLNMNDKGINAGILNDWTFGLSWFFNPNFKLQWNYSITQRGSAPGGSNGTIQGLGMRVAHDF